VDPKGTLTNKHRYVVATNDPEVRAFMRRIPGVPLVYVNRSVMILEPMTAATEDLREREEKAKFKAGLKGRRGVDAGQKRKRDDEEGAQEQGASIAEQSTGDARPQKKKRAKGPKGPNPLSIKKSKKQSQPGAPNGDGAKPKPTRRDDAQQSANQSADAAGDVSMADSGEPAKRKRKRKHKPKGDGGDGGDGGVSKEAEADT
jgi:U3 small nucleolar RNA-associated protein 23